MKTKTYATVVRPLWLVRCAVVLSLFGYARPSLAEESFTSVAVGANRLSVDLGRASIFQTQIDIQDVRTADAKVCSAEVIGNDRKQVSVVGLTRGSTTVTVWFNRPNTAPQTYIVDVVTAHDAYQVLADFVHLQYPRSSITLTPVPTSQKVVVAGSASSCSEWQRILIMIEGGGIQQRDLILRVAVPCHPCVTCYPCRSRRCR